MILCHRIGPRISSNWNLLTEILRLPPEIPISFDGVYTEVYEHYRELKGRKVTFFVSGKYVGGNNDFDLHSGEKPGRFCTWGQVFEMADYLGADVGYHGWAHKICVGMDYGQLVTELVPTFSRTGPLILAWPHGACDSLAIEVAKELGYSEAWCAGPYGDGTKFQKRRHYLAW